MGGIPPRLCAGTEPGRVHLGLLEAARTAQCLPERLLGTRRDTAPDAQTHAAPTAAHHSLLAASQTVSLMSLYYANVNKLQRIGGHAKEKFRNHQIASRDYAYKHGTDPPYITGRG